MKMSASSMWREKGEMPVFLKPEMTGLVGRPVSRCVVIISVRCHARRTQPARLESLTAVPGGERRAISSRKKKFEGARVKHAGKTRRVRVHRQHAGVVLE